MKRAGSLGANYWKLFAASATSNFGDGMALVAYPWLASAVTRNPLHIALITLATRLPWLLFSLPAGVITDRVDRRKLIVTMDVVRFGVTLAVAFIVLGAQAQLSSPTEIADGTGSVPENQTMLLATLYTSALLLGFAEVLRDNSAQTLMPSLVAKDQLEKANGRMWGAEVTMNSFVGIPLAGLLIGVALSLPFFIDAGTFAVAAALVFMLSGQYTARGKAISGRVQWRAEMGEGFRWLWHHSLLRSLAVALGVLNAMGAMVMATFVLFAQEVLQLEASSFGILMTGIAVGAVIGSLLAARISSKLGPGPALFATIIVSAVTAVAIGLATSAIVVWAMMAIQGVVIVVWNVITVSLRQTIIPDHLLGRVNSVYRFFGWGMMPLGSLLGGVLVTVSELAWDRELALRAPFLFGAAVYLLLFLYARTRLTTARVEAAKAAADSSAGPSS